MQVLNQRDAQRYARHLSLPEIGTAGQARLRSASVALVGLGGLGAPAALYLTAAGVGRLGLIDHDVVELSNLHRQVLYGDADVGRSKVEVAARALRARNPNVHFDLHATRLEAGNALELLERYDLVLDGTDNFATRYLVNDACVLLEKPNVHGSVYRFEGAVSVFSSDGGPCYRCLHPQLPPPHQVPSCAEGGVLGVMPGLIGTLQACEAIKLIVGAGVSLAGRLLLVDALALRFRELDIARDPDCPVCGIAPRIRELRDTAVECASSDPRVEWIAPHELAERLQGSDPPLLLDVRERYELDIARIETAQHIPLGEMASRLVELPRERPLVVFCRTDVRSAQAASILREAGYLAVTVMRGGIRAWAEVVDTALPRY